MKNFLFSLLFYIIACSSTTAWAQSIKFDFDKKIIHTDSLNMPRNTTAYSLLTLLPEMLQRPGDKYLSNYDIKIDDVSVGTVSDVALQQLMIDDVEKIEVCESPVSSYLNNGVGGSINLVLRSKGNNNSNTWANAGVQLSYPLDVAPQFLIGHKNEKLTMKGLFLSEIYRNDYTEETIKRDAAGIFQGASHIDNDYRYQAQLANFYLCYKPTNKDKYEVKLSETYSNNKIDVEPEYVAGNTNTSKFRTTQLSAQTCYEHKFNFSKLCVELNLLYSPKTTNKFIPNTQNYRNEVKAHTLAGKVEYNTSLLPHHPKAKMNLAIGANINSYKASDDIENMLYAFSTNLNANPKNSTHFVQPYAFLEARTAKLGMKFTAQYQHYNYEIQRWEQKYSTHSNDFIGQFIGEWHITPQRSLRLIADRKLNRPSENQLFPLLTFDLESLSYIQGNPYLRPVLSHEISLDYITNHQYGNHSLMIDTRVSYNIVDKLINTKVVSATYNDYQTYENNGDNNILSANLMALYRYNQFIMTFTGNVYHKDQTLAGVNSKYSYYNLSIHPQFNLNDGWHGGVQLVYNSKVRLKSGTLSDCSFAQMSVGKRWNNLFVYLYNRVALQKNAQDKSISVNGATTLVNYEMVPNMMGIGLKYSF